MVKWNKLSLILGNIGMILNIVFSLWSYFDNRDLVADYIPVGLCLNGNCNCPDVGTVYNGVTTTCSRITWGEDLNQTVASAITESAINYEYLLNQKPYPTDDDAKNIPGAQLWQDMPNDWPVVQNCTLTYNSLTRVINISKGDGPFAVNIFFSGIAFVLYYAGVYSGDDSKLKKYGIKTKWAVAPIMAICSAASLGTVSSNRDLFSATGANCPSPFQDGGSDVSVLVTTLAFGMVHNILQTLITAAKFYEMNFDWSEMLQEEIDFNLFDSCKDLAKSEFKADLGQLSQKLI